MPGATPWGTAVRDKRGLTRNSSCGGQSSDTDREDNPGSWQALPQKRYRRRDQLTRKARLDNPGIMIVDVKKVNSMVRQEHVRMPADITRKPGGATFLRAADQKVWKRRVRTGHQDRSPFIVSK